MHSRRSNRRSYQVTFDPTGWCAPPTRRRPTDRFQGTKPAKSRAKPTPCRRHSYQYECEGSEKDTAKLHNARFAHVSEVDEGTHWNAAVMKQITGCDPLIGKYLWADSFEFMPTHSVMLVANTLPVFRATVDEALMERLVILPFDKPIPKAERQEDIWRRIVEDEGPLLLRWMLDGAQRVIANRLPVLHNVPQAMTAAKAAYRTEASPFDMWLDERCVFAPNAKARQPDLNADLKQWLAANGKRAISRKVLRTKLEEMAETRGLESTERGKVLTWHGIGLAADGETLDLSPQAAVSVSDPEELSFNGGNGGNSGLVQSPYTRGEEKENAYIGEMETSHHYHHYPHEADSEPTADAADERRHDVC